MEKKETEQLKMIRSGDHASFQKIFEEYYSPLTVFAQKFVSDHDLAREVVQDMFVNLYEKRTLLSIQTSLKSYLYQSVRNGCLNVLKKEKTHLLHHEEIKAMSPDAKADWTDKMIETELENLIYQAINELPAKCRQIFLLSRQQAISNGEIARKLNISIRTVETQISKALKILRIKIGPYLTVFCLMFCITFI